jgi:hypothetical protein
MKIRIILILAPLLFAGCAVQDPETNNDIPWSGVVKFSYDGHQYIKFNAPYEGSVTHDPDCHCSKKNKKQ